MAQTFSPKPFQRTHCQHCHAARTSHSYADGSCPQQYRPPTLADASRELMAARASGDQARIFAARGDVQRLGGNADQLDPQP